MRRFVFALVLITVTHGQQVLEQDRFPFYQVMPVHFENVEMTDSIWAQRTEVVKSVTFDWMTTHYDASGGFSAFRQDENSYGPVNLQHGFEAIKMMEAAGYRLAHQPDPVFERYMDKWVDFIVSRQADDGYLQWPLGSDVSQRWTNLRWSHELYTFGHYTESALAYFKGTGKRRMLDSAVRGIDCIGRTFGPDGLHNTSGHEEIELALMRLYRATGESRYLKLNQFLIEQRGNHQSRESYGEYAQDHILVRRQREIVGHAVRAGFLFGGVTDFVGATGDTGLREAVEALWDDMVTHHMYNTGATGVDKANNEGYGEPYDLPPFGAYGETCSSVANVMWGQRMHRLSPEGRYYDVIERILYNAFNHCLSLSGDRFYYQNEVNSNSPNPRSEWNHCPCCPPNIAKLFLTVGNYFYSINQEGIYVNLYGGNSADISFREGVCIKQITDYPWDGNILIEVNPKKPQSFTLHLRLPGWARKYQLRLNGEPLTPEINSGYLTIYREWKSGDRIEFNMPMPPVRTYMADAFKGYEGLVALQRGPVAYAFEAVDNNGHVRNLLLPKNAELNTEGTKDIGGYRYRAITAEGKALQSDGSWKAQKLRAIPYALVNNREIGEVQVWLAQEKEAIKPKGLPRITSHDGKFVEKQTGKEFRPRGFQYIRIDTEGTHYVHTPDRYDPNAAEAMLADLEEHGFNIVRIFLGFPGVFDSKGLSDEFMGNFIDFLECAERHKVYVIPLRTHIERCTRYNNFFDLHDQEFKDWPKLGYDASRYLSQAYIDMKCQFLIDFITAIKNYNPRLLNVIFAYELENESCICSDEPPFSLKEGMFTTANGEKYDLSSEQHLQRMLDDNAIHWTNACVDAIHKIDPDAMVTTSVFTYRIVGRTGPNRIRSEKSDDSRIPLCPLALAKTNLSYLDIHFYSANKATLEKSLKSIEFNKVKARCKEKGMPLFIGEIGAFKASANKAFYKTPKDAAVKITSLIRELLDIGFAGYCYWTYDCIEQEPLWHAKSGQGEIFKALVELHTVGK